MSDSSSASQPPQPSKNRQTKPAENSAEPPPPQSQVIPVHPPPLYPQPYPPFIMNHYPPPFQQHPGPPPHPYAPSPPAPIQHHPPPHYGYSIAPPGYAPYPYQYPQPVVMYGSPPTIPQEPPQSSASPQVQAAHPAKRKRKSGPGKKDGDSDDELTPSASTPQPAAELKKRTKTQRACDSCRTRKIRCDIIPDSEKPICQHCKHYNFECTFFLPITETRFKKKRLEEDAETSKQGAVSSPTRESHSQSDTGVLGPTSPAHLLHSQATISSRIYENYDQRYNHTYEVSQSHDGLIHVQKPSVETSSSASLGKAIDSLIDREVIEKLVNAYFTDVAPLLPVVTQAEFVSQSTPAPILLYSMCLVAAARRDMPQTVFDSIRQAVQTIIRADDVLSTPSLVNVQSLLILCMMADCHSQFVPTALSALWIRLGAAIRMAQDLGLHRAEASKTNIELRRRLWAACVISDRWAALTYGHPYMIDVNDCNVRLPSAGDQNDLYMDELVRLSVILGRVLKTIYSPTGLTYTTDAILDQLLADIENWKTNLPDDLKFRGPESPRNAGLLHILYTCVCIIFWRVFMRISYSCPEHLKFSLTIEKWTNLVTLTGDAIDWLDLNERVYDVWLLVAYCATSFALVQYHTWARRKEQQSATKLRKLRDCVRRWEGSLSPEHMSARRKTAEIISLLYEATQGPLLPLETPALNPTGGVQVKNPVDGLEYRKDPSRPGGGVFVAHGKTIASGELSGLPEGTYVAASSDEEAGGDADSVAGGRRHPPKYRNHPSSSSFSPQLRGDDPVSSDAHHVSADGTTAESQSYQQSLVNLTPLDRGGGNVNPAMNEETGPKNRVINILDMPQGSLAESAMADTGFLEGIPGHMFDWSQWDIFFHRISGSGENNSATASGEQEQRSADDEHQQG